MMFILGSSESAQWTSH